MFVLLYHLGCEWSRKCSHIASYILLPKFDAQYQILQTCSCHLTRMQNSKQHKDSQFTMKNPERVLDGLITGSFIIGVDMLRLPEVRCWLNFSIQLHVEFSSLSHIADLLLLGKFIKFVCSLQNDNQISRSIHLWGTAFPASIHALSEYQKNFHTRNYVWCNNARQLLSQPLTLTFNTFTFHNIPALLI